MARIRNEDVLIEDLQGYYDTQMASHRGCRLISRVAVSHTGKSSLIFKVFYDNGDSFSSNKLIVALDYFNKLTN